MDKSTQPKISIVVPVYKAEPYLRKCLDSIQGQTYRNLEIILVDDGSPDNCPAICDEYAANDPRFKVIHKPNGGVASARNTGLDAVTGDWIGWVDSDDWIELDMYEYLLTNMLDCGADIAACGFKETGSREEVIRTYKEKLLLDREQALEKQLSTEISDGCWDKLYRKELWDGIRFPRLGLAEDLSVMWRLFQRATAVVCLPEIKYSYYHRPGSIVMNRSLANRMDNFNAAKERYDKLRIDWPQFEITLADRCVSAATGIWAVYGTASVEEQRAARPKLKEISAFCRPYLEQAKKKAEGRAGRMLLSLVAWPMWWSFALARSIGAIYERKHGRPLL